MARETYLRNEVEEPPEDGWFIDESVTAAPLEAHDDERFETQQAVRFSARISFPVLIALALLVHAVIIAAFLYRDVHEKTAAAQIEETPIEVVVEPPPEPAKPLPPPPPPEPVQPKPKEDLSPAMSAPRAPSEAKVKTETKEAKTAAPTHTDVPTQGAPNAAAPAAAPAKEATPESKEEAAKEEEKEAEALDKAKRKATKKQAKTREAKTSNQKINPNLLAALGRAPNFGAQMTFARPTPKAKIYGGTEDMRWMSEVEAMLEAKVQRLPKTAHYQSGGRVAICFHVSPQGGVILQDFCAKSGYPDIDALAMRALRAAAPFPPPPPGLDRGLIWVSSFDGQVPVLHFR